MTVTEKASQTILTKFGIFLTLCFNIDNVTIKHIQFKKWVILCHSFNSAATFGCVIWDIVRDAVYAIGGNLVFKFNMFINPRKGDFICCHQMQLFCIQL